MRVEERIPGGASGGSGSGTGGLVADAGEALTPTLTPVEATWAAIKASCSTYVHAAQCSWAGHRAMATIDVENDQPPLRTPPPPDSQNMRGIKWAGRRQPGRHTCGIKSSGVPPGST
ncbi:MAG TPA: hypothetical protein VGP64_04110 [Polyangia bacterium]|jgi:hypothetical protein